jgi:DNA polymerase-3 subunit epsilon
MNDMSLQDLADGLSTMAKALDSYPDDYRVLRRLGKTIEPPFVEMTENDIAQDSIRTGIFLDTETTGFAADDEVIELAMVRFEYSLDGRIFGAKGTFQRYREPSKPIPALITALTGITAEKVAGQKIDPEEIREFVGDAAVILAHNAAFDRPHAEKLCDVFAQKPWACSATQMDWAAEGFESAKLRFLAYENGFFYDGHRAEEDCLATLAIIGAARKTCGSALEQILARARKPSWRVWAEHAPYERKDALKETKRYTWNDGSDGRPKAWFADVDDAEYEIGWLREKIYDGRPVKLPVQKITALERFSARPVPFEHF